MGTLFCAPVPSTALGTEDFQDPRLAWSKGLGTLAAVRV